MSKQTDGRAAYTGAQIGRGNVAASRHYTPNRITRARRRLVFMRIDAQALAMIDAVAAKWRITRGEVVGRIVRDRRGNVTFNGKGVTA